MMVLDYVRCHAWVASWFTLLLMLALVYEVATQ
jgi:hypothetical protein